MVDDMLAPASEVTPGGPRSRRFLSRLRMDYKAGTRGDFGQVFGARGNGYSYGRSVDHSNRTFSYSVLPGFETTFGARWSLIEMLPGSKTRWEVALPNGVYDVTILAAGFQCKGQLQQIATEGVLVVNGTAGSDYDTYIAGTQTITVTDGRLTITNGPSAPLNCIDLIQILHPDSVRLTVRPRRDLRQL